MFNFVAHNGYYNDLLVNIQFHDWYVTVIYI